MEKKLVVITKNGFMREKKEKEIKPSDTIICETKSSEESERIMHGKFRRKI